MPVSFDDILEAFELVSFGDPGQHQVFLCRQTGELYWHSEFDNEFDELPDDIDDSKKYIALPDKRELDLGKPLALAFARQFLPEQLGEVRYIFSKRGAYAKFKNLLVRKSMLDQWHDFERRAEQAALRAWCEEHSIEVEDRKGEQT
jgi:hypothetical protein